MKRYGEVDINDMPEFKQQLIDCLKGISDDKDFILSVGNIAVLLLDGSLPKTCYKKYKINNREYNIVPVWDMKNTIAVEKKENLVGKIVEFI